MIRRLSGVEIEQTATTPQINAYIEANIYDTERWPEYRKLYRQVAGEVETVADIFTLQYILVAELEDQTRTGKDCQPQPTDPKDERLIHLIRCELMGEPLEMYKTMINPIIALRNVSFDTTSTKIVDTTFSILVRTLNPGRKTNRDIH